MRISGTKFAPRLSALIALVLTFSLSPIAITASPASAGPVTASCADGGDCAVGDVGPGGGKIVYVNQDNPITTGFATNNVARFILRDQPFLDVGDELTITGATPNVFNTTVTITAVWGPSDFVTTFPTSESVNLEPGAYIAKKSGWDYLQFAPKGWSGGALDPAASLSQNIQDISNFPGLVADRVIGSGFANSAAFLDGTIANPATDAVSVIKKYGQEWFLPSGHEMNAVGIVLGSSPEAIAENGLADLYATSTVMSQNPNCLYQTRDLFFLNIRTSTAYGYCGGFPIRPMRAIINRLSLNLNYASSTTNLVRTAIGQPEVLLPQAKRYGYRFDGWFAQAEGGSLVALGGNETTQALVANGSVLYAHWALVGSYDVAFDVQGATSGAIANATHLINGAQVPLPTEPDISYPGHHLEGWALSPEGTPIEGTYLPLSDTTLYAVWSVISCTVTFDSNTAVSGSAPDAIVNSTGAAFSLPVETQLEKPGYLFMGWATSAGTDAVSQLYCNSVGSITLYAVWHPGTYLVTFVGNVEVEGFYPSSIAFTSGEAAIKLPSGSSLRRTGHTFAGWSDNVKTWAAGSDFTPIQDSVFKAVWVPNVYTLTFATTSDVVGTAPESVDYTFGNAAVSLPTGDELARTGYHFVGWSIYSEASSYSRTIVGSLFTPTRSQTLYAVWAINKSCIDGGICHLGDVGPDGGKIIFVNLDNPITSGFINAGTGYFTTELANFLSVGDSVNIAGSSPGDPVLAMTVTAVWSDTQFVASLAPSGPVVITQETGAYIPKQSGWDYLQLAPKGWSGEDVDPIGALAYGSADIVGRFRIGEGFGNTDALLAATIEDSATDIATRIKAYGPEWFLPSSQEMLLAGRVLATTTAQAVENGFGAYYSTSSAFDNPPAYTTARPLMFMNCPEISGPCNPDNGYFFYNGGFQFRPMRALSTHATLHPNDGLSEPRVLRGKFGVPGFSGILPNEVRSGYSFAGWFDQAIGGNLIGIAGATVTQSEVPVGSELFAQWIENTYSVSYDSQGSTSGTTPAAIDWASSTGPITLSSGDLKKTGFAFLGWSESADGDIVSNTYSPAANIVLYAQWASTSFTVEFDGNGKTGGTVPSIVIYNDGDPALTLPGASGLVKVGYEFAGWSATSGGTLLSNTYTPSANIKLYAKWTPNTYAISFDGNGNTGGIQPGVINYTVDNIAATLPGSSGLVKTGYSFAGWSATAGGSLVSNSYTPSADVKLYAKWAPNVFAVTFDGNGKTSGTAPSAINYNFGNPALLVPGASGLTRSGFTFTGWSTTLGGSLLGSSFTPTANTTLFASWQAKSTLTNFRVATSLKRSASSILIPLTTASKTAIVVKAVGKCSVAYKKRGKVILGRVITAAKAKGVCNVTITTVESATTAAFKQTVKITVK